MQPSLAVALCGVELSGPLVLASGGLGEDARTLGPFMRPSVGAVVTRTLRLRGFEERREFPVPHLHIEKRGRYALNCEWGNQTGLDYWTDRGFADVAAKGHVIASVSGRHADDCAKVCQGLAPELVDLVEVNVSCSHAGALFGRLVDDEVRVAEATEAAARNFPRPPIVKLGWSPQVGAIAEVAVASGAGAIAVTNTIGPGLDVDLSTFGPVLGLQGGVGGVSGPAIFPLALEAVAQVARRVDVPVIGIGGVSTWQDAAKMIVTGASVVGVYTAALLRGPAVFDRIHLGLLEWLSGHKMCDLEGVRGKALPRLEADTQFTRMVPVVDEERCRPCPACARVCPADAIAIEATAQIDGERCTGCGACIGACPARRDAISFHGRVLR